MTKLIWAQDSWEEYLFLLEHDKRAVKKINEFIKELRRSGKPDQGTGKPEALKGELSGFWSKRINEKDRLVYCFEDGCLVIIQCRSHYNDK